MIFYPPSWLPTITQDLSTTGTVGDFVLRGSLSNASEPTVNSQVVVSADAQKTKIPRQLADDVEVLVTALAHDLQWSPNEPAQGGKIIGILSENTVDYLTCCWAIHRLGGTCLLLHGSTSPAKNTKHLNYSNCKILIVSPALLEYGRAAAAAAAVVGESNVRWYLTQPLTIDTASVETNGQSGTNCTDHHINGAGHKFKSINELLSLGKTLGPLSARGWSAEEAQARIAYLCPTSVTLGVQRLARLTHRSIIAYVLQVVALESVIRHRDVEVVLGIMPLSHVQGIVASHGSIYMRDRFILHTKFDMKEAMASIQAHHVNRLYLVPSVLAALVGNPFLFKVFDPSSVDSIYVGAGSVSADLYAKTKAATAQLEFGHRLRPAAVVMSSPHEFMPGSVGILLPLYRAHLRREDGGEVEAFDEAGELLLSSPNQAHGYLGDDETSATAFRDGWLHTGDITVFRQSPKSG